MSYDVKNAIILAAGRGSRLKHLTDDMPKALMTIKGEVLIERLIRQFQSKGVSNIYIVTGYKHEQFEYLKDIFNVHLIYNEKWASSNNIVSFYCAIAAGENNFKQHATVLCDCDLYISNDNIIEQHLCWSGYIVEQCDEHKYANEWYPTLTKMKVISKVSKTETSQHYVLRSLSFWRPLDLMSLYTYVKIELARNNTNIYIDDISCFLYAENFLLMGYVVNDDDICEIDTVNEYEEYKD